MTARIAVPALVVALLLSACGGSGQGDGAQPAAVTGADEVAIRVEYRGGFVGMIDLVSRVPVVTVYGDGRVLAEGATPAIYPGPAELNVTQWAITPAEVALFARRLRAAGVGSVDDFGSPSVVDAPDTRITVATADGVAQASVYALSGPGDDAGQRSLTDAQRAARTTLAAVIDDLREPRGTPERYAAPSLAALAIPHTESTGPGDPPQAAVAWPGPPLSGEMIGPNSSVGCVTVPAGSVREVLRAANARTPWTSGDRRWTVRFRPLLPDEAGCATLKAQA